MKVAYALIVASLVLGFGIGLAFHSGLKQKQYIRGCVDTMVDALENMNKEVPTDLIPMIEEFCKDKFIAHDKK